MKPYIVICILLLTAIENFSQPQKFSGKVQYEAVFKYSNWIKNKADKYDTSFLYFNDTASSYVIKNNSSPAIDEIQSKLQSLNLSISEVNDISSSVQDRFKRMSEVFEYKKTGTNFFSSLWIAPSGKDYCTTDTISDFEWVLHSDTIRILDILCQKATTKSTVMGNGIERLFTAWYAPIIPIANGPYKFFGLPGLIMKVESAYCMWTAIAISIPLPKDDQAQLLRCSGLSVISKKQADEIVWKQQKDMINMQKLRPNP